MRLVVVRPRWPWRLGHLTPWCWLHLWAGHFRDFQPRKRPNFSFKSPPAGDGGALPLSVRSHTAAVVLTLRVVSVKLVTVSQYAVPGLQLVPRPQCSDNLQRTKLLLSLWKPGSNHGAWRHIKIFFVSKASLYYSLYFCVSFQHLLIKWIDEGSCFLLALVYSLTLRLEEESPMWHGARPTTSYKDRWQGWHRGLKHRGIHNNPMDQIKVSAIIPVEWKPPQDWRPFQFFPVCAWCFYYS